MKDIERGEELKKEFEAIMPCSHCKIKDICKHAFTINRPNYNTQVFGIKITCNIYYDHNPKIETTQR